MAALTFIAVVTALTTLSNAHTDVLRFKEYHFQFQLPSDNQSQRSLMASDSAFNCQDISSVDLLKNLCVRFLENKEMQYKYESKPEFAAASNRNNDIISSNDIDSWNEMNYGRVGRGGYSNQCRYSNKKQECIHYNSPSNTATFSIKIGNDRVPRQNAVHFANILPANMDDNSPQNEMNMDQFMSSIPFHSFSPSYTNYDSAREFEYGDALGYNRWAADAMDWQGLDCVLCDIIGSLDIDNIFKSFGDFTYVFNEHEFDYNLDRDWTFKLGNDKKCTKAIPRLEHRICASENENGKVLISFEKDEHIRRLLNDETFADEQESELIAKFQTEFDDVTLDFDDDDLWDDITQIFDGSGDVSFRKCRAFQLAHFCVTHGDDHYLKMHMKVGTHKFQKAQNKIENKVGDMLGNLWSAANVAYYTDNDVYEYEQDLEDIIEDLQDEYDYDGNEELGDVLEEIAEEIDQDIDGKIEDEIEEEELAEEIVEEFEDDQELNELLEEIVESDTDN